MLFILTSILILLNFLKINENFDENISDNFLNLINKTDFNHFNCKKFNYSNKNEIIDGMIGSKYTPILMYLSGKSMDKESIVVEYGSWFGKSSRAISFGLKEKHNNDFYVFDLFKMIDNPSKIKSSNKIKKGQNFLHIFNKNVKEIYPKVKTFQGYINNNSKTLLPKDKKIGLFYMDCAKDLKNFKIQLINIIDKIKIGGIVVLCDFSHPVTNYCQPALTYSILKSDLELIFFSTETSHFFFKVKKKLSNKKNLIQNYNINDFNKQHYINLFNDIITDMNDIKNKYNYDKKFKEINYNKNKINIDKQKKLLIKNHYN
tara:strand:+ start:766 stop:1716 length:951 start_codon:yes stop_codon:yes gene_type:complete